MFKKKKTEEKHVSLLLLWCHPNVQKMWQPHLTPNCDINTLLLVKTWTVAIQLEPHARDQQALLPCVEIWEQFLISLVL